MNSRSVCQSLMIMAAVLLAPAADAESPDGPRPQVLHVTLSDDPITPVTARFIQRALRQARTDGADCFILELDTPGGLMTSTHQIVKDILQSPVPVVVYVSPSGGRAASAGVFITLASHVAAMAPGTHIGAAHPVQLGMPGSPQPPDSEGKSLRNDPNKPAASAVEEKQINDAVAWARSLAQMRGRNAEWAAAAVTESDSLTAPEALDTGVIDIIAATVDELLDQLDGRRVQLDDRTVTLHTRRAAVTPVSMWWGENALSVLSNPNIAFLLLIFGFYGVLFELYTPGWGVSGTLGAICLMLGCFGLSVLPVNFAGLLLMLAALVLFVAEALTPTYGALTLGGIVCLVFGGMMLVDTPVQMMRVSLAVLIPVALATAAITVFLVANVIKGHRRRPQTGDGVMFGKQAKAADDFTQTESGFSGTVWVHGEYWKAQCRRPVAAGQTVIIQQRRGLILDVAVENPQNPKNKNPDQEAVS